MNWLIYTLGSVLFYTAMNLIQKVVADKSGSPRASGFIFNFFAAAITLVIFLFNHQLGELFSKPQNASAWIFLGLGGLFYGLFERSRYQAAQLLDASIFTTILTFGTLVAFIGSSILYQEPITTYKLIGASLILISLVLAAHDKRKNKKKISKKGLLIGLMVSTFMGLGWMLDKMGTRYFGASVYSVYAWVFGLPIVFFPSINMDKLKIEFLRSWQSLLFLAGLNALGYLFQLEAISMAEATRVIPMVQTTTLLTVIFGIVILKEKDNIPQKIIAAILALVGTYFLI